ncbi:MAG: hypothetical protein ACK5I7_04320 [Anaerotignum sp.]
MNLFELTNSVALSITCTKKYTNCAFDGCHYYFTVQCSCEIIKTDCCFQPVACYNATKEYDCICYDQTSQCFWATSKKQNNVVFKLNSNMCEIDYTQIIGYQDYLGDIVGVSYNCYTDGLVVSYANCILQCNKENGLSTLLYKSNYMQITSVMSLSPNVIFSGVRNNEQCIYVLDANGNITLSQSMNYENHIQNIVFNPCVDNDDNTYLDFFVLKKGYYPYIFRCNVFLDALPAQPYECNFNICNECCCSANECNADSRASILESIAQVEAQIAHILNCEAEKMQKIISESSDLNVILVANREVNKTIANVSQLEYLLYLKLNALAESGTYNELCIDTISNLTESSTLALKNSSLQELNINLETSQIKTPAKKNTTKTSETEKVSTKKRTKKI